jgi:segregation and condensation protein B
MVMRLVRDDDYGPMELEEELQPPRPGAEAIDDDTDATEPQDGVVADSAEDLDAAEDTADGSDSADSATSSAIDDSVSLGALEALLLTTHHPLTAGRIAEILDLPTTKPIRKAIKALNESYASSDRSFRIEQVAGGYQILTLPEYGDLLKRFHQKEVDAKLTKAAIETLAIIAYKQPILRADVESIRGVACGETIRSLMEKHLVKIAGRAEEPGRPILYGTTKRFLELFGLNSVKDLPQPDALIEKAKG